MILFGWKYRPKPFGASSAADMAVNAAILADPRKLQGSNSAAEASNNEYSEPWLH